jgi:predicted permease
MVPLVQDVRYALRQLRNSPGFTITAIITLALGLGANTAIFTLVHGILLRSLPVHDPAQLYRIGDTDNCCVNGGFVGQNGDFDIFSYQLFQHLKQSAPEFESLAAMQAGQPRFSVRRGQDLARELRGEWVTGNYFSTLGVGAFTGRTLTDADDQTSAPPVLVLSYRAWQTQFAADPSVIGSTISIQARPFTVIGIAPAGFYGDRVTDSPADFWMPLATEPYVHGQESSTYLHPDANWLYPLGRVRPGTSIPALQQKLSAALREWLRTRPVYTDHGGSSEIPKQHVVIVPGGRGIENLQLETGKGLRMLMILSAVVLIIACANIANLLLARSTRNRSVIAIRMAMGAARTRIIRQSLTEGVVLSCLGGIAGLAVAYAGSRTILALAFPDAHNMPVDAGPSLTVLAFAFAVSLLTGILFGSAPAWLAMHAQPADVLRGSSRTTKDGSGFSQKILVVFQAALSIVLIAVAILMTRSLGKLEHQDFGLSTTNRYVVHVDTAGTGYPTERLTSLYRELITRVGSLPGAAHVSMAMYSPLEGDNWGECVIQQGHPAPGPNDHCGSTWEKVTPEFLQSIGVTMARGRDFNSGDTASTQRVAIVNATFVKHFFPKEDPIGRRFGIDDTKYSGAFEIVGVFHDFKMNNPREETRPVFLRLIDQPYGEFKEPQLVGLEKQSTIADAMIVQFQSPQNNAEELLRRTIASVDPSLTVVEVTAFGDQVKGNFNQERLLARLTSLFGILALVLASIGLYGVMSYFVARRTSEIGIRMALGATRGNVLQLILRGAGLQILVGLLIGIPCALLAGRLASSQLYGVSAHDPLAFAGAAILLAICALVAGVIPARRAASIEPMKALRTE